MSCLLCVQLPAFCDSDDPMIVNKASPAGEVLFTGTGAVVREENAVTNLGSGFPPSHPTELPPITEVFTALEVQ